MLSLFSSDSRSFEALVHLERKKGKRGLLSGNLVCARAPHKSNLLRGSGGTGLWASKQEWGRSKACGKRVRPCGNVTMGAKVYAEVYSPGITVLDSQTNLT